MGTKLLIGILLAFCASAIWLAFTGWNIESEVEMSGHGYAAMTLGIVFSLVVGIGLMALVFYSSRKGYDDAAYDDQAGRNAPDDNSKT